MQSDNFQQNLMADFLLETAERTERVEEILVSLSEAEASTRVSLLNEVKREVHTLKGNAGMMGFSELQMIAHQFEDLLSGISVDAPKTAACLAEVDRFRRAMELLASQDERHEANSDNAATSGSLRVPFASLDALMDLLAEMVIFRNRLSDSIRTGRFRKTESDWDDVQNAEESLGKTLTYIQDHVMRLRMVPLRTLFSRLRRIVYDESLREKKEVQLETEGGDVPLDKALLEVANEALGHLIRNAVVHGIERPATRQKTGKSKFGKIQVSAFIHSNEVEITVADDGAGIDRAALTSAAAQRGIDTSNIEDLAGLLFLPGVSTRKESDLSSGRGIGLSAAQKAVQQMGGRIEVTSNRGSGTTFRLHLPLSVSITRSLMLRVDQEIYALPLISIRESIRFDAEQRHQINNAGVLRWREYVIPILDLGCVFGTANQIRTEGRLVIIHADGKDRGIVVDEVMGIREIVVKGLDPMVGNAPGVSGSTILGDGRVVLILDPSGLMNIKPFLTQNQAILLNPSFV
jgi:two-component system, chemotaxis family, sensor kinase CheA